MYPLVVVYYRKKIDSTHFLSFIFSTEWKSTGNSLDISFYFNFLHYFDSLLKVFLVTIISVLFDLILNSFISFFRTILLIHDDKLNSYRRLTRTLSKSRYLYQHGDKINVVLIGSDWLRLCIITSTSHDNNFGVKICVFQYCCALLLYFSWKEMEWHEERKIMFYPKVRLILKSINALCNVRLAFDEYLFL